MPPRVFLSESRHLLKSTQSDLLEVSLQVVLAAFLLTNDEEKRSLVTRIAESAKTIRPLRPSPLQG